MIHVKRPARWMMLLVSILSLIALLASAAPSAAQTGELSQRGNRINLPFVVRAPDPEPPLPPQISNRSMTLRPVPLEQVQRGTTLSVEFRYRNEGNVLVNSDTFSLFYPQNLVSYEWADLRPGDRFVTVDGQRVVIQLVNVVPGEQRTGRINFQVNRLAPTNSLIDLFAEFFCQPGVNCFTNTSRIQVIPNENETSNGGTFTMPVSPDRGPPGTAHTFFGSRFIPGEEYRTWLNTPNGVQPLNISGVADRNGNIQFTFGSGQLTQAGFYSMVAHGTISGVQNVGPFIVQINGFPGSLSTAAGGFAGGADLTVAGPHRVAPAPLRATGSGVISGRVQQTSGAGLGGVLVKVFDASGSLLLSTLSVADGSFVTPASLGSGTYLVQALPGATNDPALANFAANEVADVSVVDATTTAGVVVTLPAAGGLTGIITGGGAPIKDVRVYAEDATGNVVGGTVTNSSGAYTITNLLPGEYTLAFDRRAAERGGAYVGAKSVTANVSEGTITPVANFALQRSATSGTLGGTVRDATSGAGIADVLVVITNTENDFVSIATSGADGSYTSGALPPGNYRLQFVTLFSRSSTTAQYSGAIYNNAANFAAATPVTVGVGEAVSGIDAALTAGGTISGTVSGDELGPLAGVLVKAFDANGRIQAVTTSDRLGAYQLRGLGAGSYNVRFTPLSSASPSTRAFTPASYDADPSSDAIDPVVLGAGANLTSINISLFRGAQIIGTVSSDRTGAPLPGVAVVVIEAPEGGPAALVGVGLSDADGRYSSPALVSGNYKLLYTTVFAADTTSRTYQSEFFNNARTLDEATSILIGRALTSRTINVALSPGGAIAGKITSAESSAGLAGVLVIARANGTVVGGTVSDGIGDYKVESLPPGEVTLEFVTRLSPSLAVRDYAGSTSDPVVVTVGNTTDLDVALNLAP
ncbi:MAG: MSCRAMM family protein [Oscillochloridaceae bacterium umkhey_bin13]